MGSPREYALQGVWASRVTGVVEDGSSGDEGVLDSGSGCAYAEENGIVELFTEECSKDDPRSSPSVCPHLFLLTCFVLQAHFGSCHCYHFSSSGLQYKRCKGRSRNKGKNRKRRSPPGASPKEKEVHMCFACFACVFLLRCHYWLHVACIAVLVLACVYILVMV